MRVESLCLSSFRNYYESQTISFDPGANIIIGENGQGKTNLLEAIYYLSGAKSFRTRFDKEVIGFHENAACLLAKVFLEDRQQTIEIRLSARGRREIYLNGVKEKTALALAGKLGTVLFSPEDLSLLRGGAVERRRFLDLAIGQISPKYAFYLSEFSKLYSHKTRILKDHREKPSLLDTLGDFNLRLAQVGAQICYYRGNFIEKLAPIAREIHWDFSGGREALTLSYQTVKEVENPLEKPSVILGQLLEQQERLYRAEIDAGLCLAGVQKDDMELSINGILARSFASQGQTRTGALSLKLAERELLYQSLGAYPILLLDDVLSELDATRQDFVLNRISQGQVFITCCEASDIAQRTGGTIFEIAGGRVV